MKKALSRRIRTALFVAALLSTLACQAVFGLGEPQPAATPSRIVFTHIPTAPASPTPTLQPSPTDPPPSATPEPTATPTLAPSATPTVPPAPSAVQLEVFDQLWEAVRDNYLYTDFNGVDWEAARDHYRPFVEAGLSQDDFYALMTEMIYSLGDDHSTFLSPQEASDEKVDFAGENEYVGIGVLTAPVEGQNSVTVIIVFPGSPAEKAGIHPHDNILEVEGQPVIEGDVDRRTLLKGHEGDSVEILVQTPGEAPRAITLARARVHSTTPVPYSLLESASGKRTGYILLVTFAEETISRQFGDALKALTTSGPLDGLIVDVRRNNGGIDSVTRETLGYFTSGVTGYFVNREGERAFNIFGRDINGSLDVPLAILVGQDTASFAEIFAGILQDLGRAKIVGEVTNGNVEILWPYEFEDGSLVWLAHDTFRPRIHPEQDWEQAGIVPDIVISSNWDEVTLETDPVVKAAQELLENGPSN